MAKSKRDHILVAVRWSLTLKKVSSEVTEKCPGKKKHFFLFACFLLWSLTMVFKVYTGEQQVVSKGNRVEKGGRDRRREKPIGQMVAEISE